ncbi:hypothetical protein HZS61_005152 [Fusarium oxysporum f. sp. conglutinans]|uniref:Uncharacterized protein n=2 Tax=Fusarium oxysporum f. sp. conglutinans TaxID=100902 RepID=A0A8H6GCN5_FUSOX|nr:hypothetical protein HZS61_005152 [Fusarium oxysporum f. sp. conglutinans]KAG6980145.1 hypothetical protein FocnCong_v009506 [Fusarium oxysporum f. sp. conglutinans]
MNLFCHTLRVRTFTSNLHASAPFHGLLQRRYFSGSISVKQTRNLGLAMNGHGDLNNFHAGRAAIKLAADPAYSYQSLAINFDEDDVEIREQYRAFLFDGNPSTDDWISELELSTAIKMVQSEILDKGLDRLHILVLYGSLRSRSYSRLLAYEAGRRFWLCKDYHGKKATITHIGRSNAPSLTWLIQDEIKLWRSKGSIGKLHNIIHWVQRSCQRIENTALNLEDKTTYNVVTDNAARWNSSEAMMERGYELRNALDCLVQAEVTEWNNYVARRTQNRTKPMPKKSRTKPAIVDDKMSVEDWSVITEYLAILKPLKIATKRLKGRPKEGKFGAIWEVLLTME